VLLLLADRCAGFLIWQALRQAGSMEPSSNAKPQLKPAVLAANGVPAQAQPEMT
jgi:hypothetical protein